MYAWSLCLLCYSGCLACRCLVTAKTGDQACCMNLERDFRMLPHGQDGLSCFWFVFPAPFPKGSTHLAQLRAGWHTGPWYWAESFPFHAEYVLRLACKMYNSRQEAWKVQLPMCDSTETWRCFWRKEGPSWAPDGTTGKGKQAVTRKVAKCCLGLGQIPVVPVNLSQCSAETSREKSSLSDAHTRNTMCPSQHCSQIQLWRVWWTVRAQEWDLVFLAAVGTW